MDLERAFQLFSTEYEAKTGTSWSKEKFFKRAANWNFYGDDNGYIAVRPQRSGFVKLVGAAGSNKSKYKALKEIQDEKLPIWGMVSQDILGLLKKSGFIVPPAIVVKFLIGKVPISVFGGVDFSVNGDGSITLKYDDVGDAKKYFVGSKEYFKLLVKNGVQQYSDDMPLPIKLFLKPFTVKESINFEQFYNLIEKRKNPAKNTVESIYDIAKKYKDDPNVYISFVQDLETSTNNENIYRHRPRGDIGSPKIGINPKSLYDTPNGIYTYPLKQVYDATKDAFDIPFAANSPIVYFVRKNKEIDGIDDISRLKEDQFKKYVDKLARSMGSLITTELQKVYPAADSSKFIPLNSHILKLSVIKTAIETSKNSSAGGRLWNITRVFSLLLGSIIKEKHSFAQYFLKTDSESSDADAIQVLTLDVMEAISSMPKKSYPNIWNSIWRKVLGIDYIADKSGKGIIHINEPIQAVFFSYKAFDIIKAMRNDLKSRKAGYDIRVIFNKFVKKAKIIETTINRLYANFNMKFSLDGKEQAANVSFINDALSIENVAEIPSTIYEPSTIDNKTKASLVNVTTEALYNGFLQLCIDFLIGPILSHEPIRQAILKGEDISKDLTDELEFIAALDIGRIHRNETNRFLKNEYGSCIKFLEIYNTGKMAIGLNYNYLDLLFNTIQSTPNDFYKDIIEKISKNIDYKQFINAHPEPNDMSVQPKLIEQMIPDNINQLLYNKLNQKSEDIIEEWGDSSKNDNISEFLYTFRLDFVKYLVLKWVGDIVNSDEIVGDKFKSFMAFYKEIVIFCYNKDIVFEPTSNPRIILYTDDEDFEKTGEKFLNDFKTVLIDGDKDYSFASLGKNIQKAFNIIEENPEMLLTLMEKYLNNPMDSLYPNEFELVAWNYAKLIEQPFNK